MIYSHIVNTADLNLKSFTMARIIIIIITMARTVIIIIIIIIINIIIIIIIIITIMLLSGLLAGCLCVSANRGS